MADGDDRISRILRTEMPRVRAGLIGLLGDFDLAQDVLGHALLRCAERWPVDGIPDNPAGWLYTVARNRARDLARHHSRGERAATHVELEHERATEVDLDALVSGLNDDYLRLIFTCCHPALDATTQICLTLHSVVGLGHCEIARAMLAGESAIEQRLTRAKRKIRVAAIAWQVPREHELPERLQGVLTVLYLIFTEGYAATRGAALTREDLCRTAIRLAREVNRLLRGHAEALALLALLLFQDSRRKARTDANGDLVLLPAQDRALWNREAIVEAQVLLEKAIRLRQVPGEFLLQAAIAALHAEAVEAGSTDWAQIASIYQRLEVHTGSSVVRLNRAVAVAMADGPVQGLALLTSLANRPEMQRYHLYHSTRADLLARCGRNDEARAAFCQALEFAANDAERRYLEARIAALSLA